MKILFYGALLFYVTSTAFCSVRLIGGSIDREEINNGFLVYNLGGGSCSGSKVYGQFILTAAHCLDEIKPPFKGQSIWFTNAPMPTMSSYAKLEIDEVYINKSYVYNSNIDGEDVGLYHADLALIKIKVPLDNEHLWHNLASLNLDWNQVADNTDLKIWGYGCQLGQKQESFQEVRKVGNSKSIDLNTIESNLLLDRADEIYKINIISRGQEFSSDSASVCSGDSGGPVMVGGKIVGVNTYSISEEGKDVSKINTHARLALQKNWLEEIFFASQPEKRSCYSKYLKTDVVHCMGSESICYDGTFYKVSALPPHVIKECSENKKIQDLYRK
jgi:secreted trypsin-like serine protease